MKHKLMWIFSAVPLILVIIALPHLPETIPIRFGISGQAEAFASRYTSLIMGIIPLLTALIPELYLHFRAKSIATEKDAAALQSNRKALINFFMWINLFSIVLTVGFLALAKKNAAQIDSGFPMPRMMAGGMGLLMLLAGNILPKTRKNAIFGIRMKWTFYNDVTWSKTHRFAGVLLITYGIFQIIAALVLPDMLPLYFMLAALALILLILFVYAYKIYQEESSREK